MRRGLCDWLLSRAMIRFTSTSDLEAPITVPPRYNTPVNIMASSSRLYVSMVSKIGGMVIIGEGGRVVCDDGGEVVGVVGGVSTVRGVVLKVVIGVSVVASLSPLSLCGLLLSNVVLAVNSFALVL